MAKPRNRKQELTAELAEARRALTMRRAAVSQRLDFGGQFRRHLARNAVAWLMGAVVFGIVISRLPARKTKVKLKKRDPVDAGTVAKTGLLLTVAKLAFDAARPALLKMAMTRLQPLIEKALNRWRTPR